CRVVSSSRSEGNRTRFLHGRLSRRILRRLTLFDALFRARTQHRSDLRRVNAIDQIDFAISTVCDADELESKLDANVARVRQEVFLLDYLECFIRRVAVGKWLVFYQRRDLIGGAFLTCFYPRHK